MKKIRLTRYGAERTYLFITCDTCHKKFPKRCSFIKEESKNFCSPKCQKEYNYVLYQTSKEGFKKCRKCKKEKLLDEFYKQNTSKDGRTAKCKICICKYLKERYPETKLKKGHKERKKRINRIWSIKKKYGLTEKNYTALLEKQNNVCAICKNPETRKVNGEIAPLSIDHCHKTNKIRGLLCNNCNVGLGRFKDNYKLLEVSILYLKKYSEIGY